MTKWEKQMLAFLIRQNAEKIKAGEMSARDLFNQAKAEGVGCGYQTVKKYIAAIVTDKG